MTGDRENLPESWTSVPEYAGTSGGGLYRFFGMTKETTVDNIKDAMRRRGLHEKMITVEKAGQR